VTMDSLGADGLGDSGIVCLFCVNNVSYVLCAHSREHTHTHTHTRTHTHTHAHTRTRAGKAVGAKKTSTNKGYWERVEAQRQAKDKRELRRGGKRRRG
jgi:hypothetical protein